jgi:hypothetical protein
MHGRRFHPFEEGGLKKGRRLLTSMAILLLPLPTAGFFFVRVFKHKFLVVMAEVSPRRLQQPAELRCQSA